MDIGYIAHLTCHTGQGVKCAYGSYEHTLDLPFFFSQVNVNSGLISMNTVIEGPDILEYENTKSSNMESAR